MKIKKFFSNNNQKWSRRASILGGLLLGFIGLSLTGCSDDLGMGQYGDLGDKKHASVKVSFGGETPTVVSRSVDFSQDAMVKIDSYWVGLFDTRTGELIGSKSDTAPRKADGTRYNIYNGDGNPFTVEDIDIYYYDNNPEAYIVGVVNYNGVKAKISGESSDRDLQEILKGIQSFNEVCKIVVNTESIDRANPAESNGLSPMPLMMGFYSAQTPGVHTTVTSSGTVNEENANAVKIRLVGGNDNHSQIALPSGAIRLQRLIAEMNFTIKAGENVTIHSVEYMVCNNPVDVFLAEHPTDGNGGTTTDRNAYLNNTANSADYYNGSEGYKSDSYFRSARANNGEYTLSYQSYENKHWGRKWNFPEGYDQTSHLVRETKYDDKNSPTGKSDVYRTLCADVNNPFNNNASYIVLKVDADFVTYYRIDEPSDPDVPPVAVPGGDPNDEGRRGPQVVTRATINYIIHEGAASRPNGAVNTAESRGYDYQRIRNTQYDYTVTVAGMNQLMVNVYSSLIGQMPPEAFPGDMVHNDGITGEAWQTNLVECDPETWTGFGMSIQTKEEFDRLMWRVWEKTPDGEENFGNWKADPNAPAGFPAWPALQEKELSRNIPVTSGLNYYCHAIYLPNYPSEDGSNAIYMSELNSTAHPEITFPAYFRFMFGPIYPDSFKNPDDYRRGMYLYFTDDILDDDGCSLKSYVIGYERGARDMRPGYEYNLNIQNISGRDDAKWDGNVNSMTQAYWMVLVPNNSLNYAPKYCLLQIDNLEPYRIDMGEPMSPRYDYGVGFMIPSGLTPGYHDVKITVYGPDSYKTGETREYNNLIYIADNSKWTFEEGSFYYNYYHYGDWPNSTTRIDGLTIMNYGSGNKGFDSVQDGYIQTGGSGAMVNRSFRLEVDRPGTFRIAACRASNTEGTDRGLNLYKEAIDRSYSGSETFVDYAVVEVSNASRDSKTYDLHTGAVDQPYNFTIFSTGSLRIYSIEFIPD